VGGGAFPPACRHADVVRQEPEREKGIRLTLRTVEREVRHLRRELDRSRLFRRAPPLGAEIRGVDLARPIEGEAPAHL
jgi:hypothetical protein